MLTPAYWTFETRVVIGFGAAATKEELMMVARSVVFIVAIVWLDTRFNKMDEVDSPQVMIE